MAPRIFILLLAYLETKSTQLFPQFRTLIFQIFLQIFYCSIVWRSIMGLKMLFFDQNREFVDDHGGVRKISFSNKYFIFPEF